MANRPLDEPIAYCWAPLPGSLEPQGFLHYRRVYRGDNDEQTHVSSSAQKPEFRPTP